MKAQKIYRWEDFWGDVHWSEYPPEETPTPMGGKAVPEYEVFAAIPLEEHRPAPH
jgi:hypothetical protein